MSGDLILMADLRVAIWALMKEYPAAEYGPEDWI